MAVKYLQIYLFFPHYYTNIYMVVSRSKCNCQSFLLSTSQKTETGRKESRCTFQNHVNGFSHHQTMFWTSRSTLHKQLPNYTAERYLSLSFCFFMKLRWVPGSATAVKWLRWEADRSPPPNVNVKMTAATPALPLHALMVHLYLHYEGFVTWKNNKHYCNCFLSAS